MDKFLIFIVEDDSWYSEFLSYHLALNPDYKITVFRKGSDCLKNLSKKPKVITIDYSLPDMNGGELLKAIQDKSNDIATVVISGQEDVSTAINLLKTGAYDYIVKDDNTRDRLWNSIKNIRQNYDLQKEVKDLRNQLKGNNSIRSLIKGSSKAIQETFSLIDKATSSNITVSITGETGTGKELVAKAIHQNSARAKKPFVAVNISAIPKELIESELFGFEKGAFTGATVRRTGKFEEASGGTIFLDEIAEMDINIQSKLLRVLQEKEVTRLGSNKAIKIDTRIMIATHKNLTEEVKNKNFREDLFYRLLGLPIKLPPLRERREDIITLATFFLETYAKENKTSKYRLTEKAVEKLLNYNYPGNIRELKACIELSAVLCEQNTIKDENITFTAPNVIENLFNQEMSLREFTHKIIQHYLDKYNNNVIKVSEVLDIGKSTIYRILKEIDKV